MTNQTTQTPLNKKDITNKVISKDGEYKTRDGRKVEILTTSRDHKFNVVALVEGSILETYTQNGGFYNNGNMSNLDLVEVQNIEEGLKRYDLVMVSDNDGRWYLRFFSHYDLIDGLKFVWVFNNGFCHGAASPWGCCRKATPEEIIENKDQLN